MFEIYQSKNGQESTQMLITIPKVLDCSFKMFNLFRILLLHGEKVVNSQNPNIPYVTNWNTPCMQ